MHVHILKKLTKKPYNYTKVHKNVKSLFANPFLGIMCRWVTYMLLQFIAIILPISTYAYTYAYITMQVASLNISHQKNFHELKYININTCM